MNLVGTLLKLQTEKANTPKDTAKVVDPVAELQSQLRTYNIIDLLLILLPHLTAAKNLASSSLASSLMAENSPIFLLYRVLVGQLRDTDVTLEKRTYKALNAVVQLLLPSADVVSQISASRAQQVLPLVEDLVSKLIDPEVLAICSSGAKKARMELIAKVVESIPLSCDIVYSNSLSIISSADAPITLGDDVLLSFIPIALSEVMLCTKEASEKARTAAFETLAVMASKMLSAGKKFGTHNQTNDASMLETSGMDDEDMTSTESVEKEDTGAAKDKLNFREFMMMVVAGLAGASAGMQSSSISCVARLIFEFRGKSRREEWVMIC